MRVVVRGFQDSGFHRDLANLSEVQVHSTWGEVRHSSSSMLTGLIGVGVRIDPRDFKEMDYFEIVIVKD